MIEHLSLPSLLAVLVAICSLFIISGGWLYLLATRSRARQVHLSGFGINVTINVDQDDAF